MYHITKKFTSGTLEGLTHTTRSSVYLPVGFECKNPIGGSPYIVTASVPFTEQERRDEQYIDDCEWAESKRLGF